MKTQLLYISDKVKVTREGHQTVLTWLTDSATMEEFLRVLQKCGLDEDSVEVVNG